MRDAIIEIVERVPLASVLTLITAVGALVALVTGEIDFLEFAAVVGGVSAGTGVLGIARNGAGHGTR